MAQWLFLVRDRLRLTCASERPCRQPEHIGSRERQTQPAWSPVERPLPLSMVSFLLPGLQQLFQFRFPLTTDVIAPGIANCFLLTHRLHLPHGTHITLYDVPS